MFVHPPLRLGRITVDIGEGEREAHLVHDFLTKIKTFHVTLHWNSLSISWFLRLQKISHYFCCGTWFASRLIDNACNPPAPSRSVILLFSIPTGHTSTPPCSALSTEVVTAVCLSLVSPLKTDINVIFLRLNLWRTHSN